MVGSEKYGFLVKVGMILETERFWENWKIGKVSEWSPTGILGKILKRLPLGYLKVTSDECAVSVCNCYRINERLPGFGERLPRRLPLCSSPINIKKNKSALYPNYLQKLNLTVTL